MNNTHQLLHIQLEMESLQVEQSPLQINIDPRGFTGLTTEQAAMLLTSIQEDSEYTS